MGHDAPKINEFGSSPQKLPTFMKRKSFITKVIKEYEKRGRKLWDAEMIRKINEFNKQNEKTNIPLS